MPLKKVTIYTDGACSGNPGPGGYAAIMVSAGNEKVITGGFRNTTNNRMEMMAVINALKALKESCSVQIVSDSEYIVNAVNKGWAVRWRDSDWKRNKKEKALNPDLWEQLLSLVDLHDVTFLWTRGHNGNEYNERCDQLAVEAAQQPLLTCDIGYEKNS